VGGHRLQAGETWFGIYYVYYLQGRKEGRKEGEREVFTSVYLSIVPFHSNHHSHVAWVKFQGVQVSVSTYFPTFPLTHLHINVGESEEGEHGHCCHLLKQNTLGDNAIDITKRTASRQHPELA
jgi:hypothetical protein